MRARRDRAAPWDALRVSDTNIPKPISSTALEAVFADAARALLKNVERTQFDPWKLEGLGFGFVHLVCGKDLDRRHDSFAAPQSDIHAVPRRQCEFARCSVDFGQ
jgi:hypothetical protein